MRTGIEKIVKKFCVQTAVYWAPAVSDGYGGMVFAEPVEIDCRWDIKSKLITTGAGSSVTTNPVGEQIISTAEVLVMQDLQVQGYLFLGTLDDLDSDQLLDPRKKEGSYKILRFDKIPMVMSTTEFVRKAYL